MVKPNISINRKVPFTKTIELISKVNNPNIVEIGTTRIEGNWDGDGYSTIHFAHVIAESGGTFTSVDIDPKNAEVSAKIIKDHGIPFTNVDLLTEDGLLFAKGYKEKIDLLYLDAWDYTKENKYNSEKNHLECFKNFYKNRCLRKNSLVLIDDIIDNKKFTGKGELLIPYMLSLGFELVVNDSQVLMRKI